MAEKRAKKSGIIKATAALLGKTVSWSVEGEPISFEQFLVSRMPEIAATLGLDCSNALLPSEVRRFDELSEDEKLRVVYARLEGGETRPGFGGVYRKVRRKQRV